MLHAMANWCRWWLVAAVLELARAHAFADAVPPTPASGSGTPQTETVPRAEPVVDGAYPKIYLVTMGIGSLIWERHGHIALCVEYGEHQEPVCYNYGIGDFHDPLKMVWGFFRGANSFWAGKDTWRNMMWVYYQFDRTIWRQLLPLDADQESRKVLVSSRARHPRGRANYYAYDHFDDNCTTRIRNIIDDVTGGALSSMPDKTDGRTYRDYARDGFAGMRIPLIGTDIAMGRSTDRVPTYYERMFLPQYLREAVATKFGVQPIAVYVRKECAAEYHDARQAGREPDRDCVERGIPTVPDPPSGRVILALCLLAASAPVWLTRLWGRLQRTGLAIAVVPYVLLGAIFLFLALISPLPYVKWNETYLVWLPIDAVVLFLRGERQRSYAKGRLIMLGVMIVLMIFHVLKQPLWPEMVWPIVPMLAVAFMPEKQRT